MTWPGWSDVLPALAATLAVVAALIGGLAALARLARPWMREAAREATEALYERMKANDFKHVEDGMRAIGDRLDRMASEARADRMAFEKRADRMASEARADRMAFEKRADRMASEARADRRELRAAVEDVRRNIVVLAASAAKAPEMSSSSPLDIPEDAEAP